MSHARLLQERAFHDSQADARARTLLPADYLVDDDAYLHHESWIAPAFAALGDVLGLRVLDLGCGHGMASVVLARRGARVTACDLSLGYVREAGMRARANNVAFDRAVCDGEALPFRDGAFDRVWANAVLHHLDIDRAGRELSRILAPGGIAVFCEPWAGNRVLNWARSALPYPGKHRTADESPMAPGDLKVLRRHFTDVSVTGHQLVAMLGRVVRVPALKHVLTRCDDWILHAAPSWQRYCRYVVIVAKKGNVPASPQASAASLRG